MDQREKMIRRHEETLEALEDIEGGRVIADKKVINWLASWGDKDELTPPNEAKFLVTWERT